MFVCVASHYYDTIKSGRSGKYFNVLQYLTRLNVVGGYFENIKFTG